MGRVKKVRLILGGVKKDKIIIGRGKKVRLILGGVKKKVR